MNERENFLARWSRRKLEIEDKTRAADPSADSAAGKAADDQPAAGGADVKSRAEGAAPDGAATAEPEFDFLSRLPSIESITATTDIRAFLTPGVPPELTRAALRRAWSVDPSIRDYIGLAENQWDFNSGEIPGFGPLDLTDDLRKIVAEIVGGGPGGVAEPAAVPAGQAASEESQPAAGVAESPAASGPKAVPTAATATVSAARKQEVAARDENLVQGTKENVAMQQEEPAAKDIKPAQHGHGGALPR